GPRDAVLRDPERADGGGVDHAAHARRACGLEDGARATDVDAVELLRVGRPEAVVGRDVEDDVDALHRALHGGWIQQVSLADLDVEPCKRAAVSAWSRQHAHRAALGEELADDVGANEARATGHERVGFHSTGGRGSLAMRPSARATPHSRITADSMSQASAPASTQSRAFALGVATTSSTVTSVPTRRRPATSAVAWRAPVGPTTVSGTTRSPSARSGDRAPQTPAD